MPKTNRSPESYRKPCSLCHKPRDVLVRCQIDESITSTLSTTKKSATDHKDPSANASENTNDENNDGDDDDDDDNYNNDPTNPSSPSSSTTNQPPSLKPNAWHFVCPGSCWKRVSGGVIDGDLAEGREGYRYGGMWKNKHAGVSAKVPRRLKGKLGREGEGKGKEEENEKEGSEEGESEEGEE